MSLRLPDALQSGDNNQAVCYLRAYYEPRPGTPLGMAYAGARFDAWDSTGSRHADRNRFTADDLVAVTCLNVTVSPKAAWVLLSGNPAPFSRLLEQVADQDLAEIYPCQITPSWAPWQLWDQLRELPGIDWVIASKLIARKRPRLIPIYDRVVKTVTGGNRNFWVPLCSKLRQDDSTLHNRLLALRDEAEIPPHVPALRVFDIIAWMEGKQRLGL